MAIVLNEHDWAREMINNRTLGSKPFETLCRVARYYIDTETVLHYPRDYLRHKLEVFLLSCEPSASIPKWSQTIESAMDRAYKTPAVSTDGIIITKGEMESIDSLDGKQIKRLAFVLLCLSKYWNISRRTSDYWVTNKDTEVMRLANINTSIKRQSAMYRILNEKGFIKFSKRIYDTSIRVCFADENSDAALVVSDFRNLGWQYSAFYGEPFFKCDNCGLTVRQDNKRGRKPKYCKDCAIEMKIKQAVDSVMRKRCAK